MILHGVAKLLQSARGTLAILTLLLSSGIAMTGKMTPAFAATVGSVVTVFTYARGKNQDTQSKGMSNGPTS